MNHNLFGEPTLMLSYPVNLERDNNNTYLVTFPDIPEAVSVSDDEDEALLNALDALESAIEIYFDEKREVPAPSKPERAQRVVTLPTSSWRRCCWRMKWCSRVCASRSWRGG